MVTPVNADGSLDTAAICRIIESFVAAGVSPLLMGTTGEGNSVSHADALLMVSTAVRAASGKVLVYVALAGNCVSEQISAGNAYIAAGADVLAATLPSYYALTDEQMYDYYKCLADNIHGPLMIYNIKATTHMSIPLNVVERLSHHPNIVGMKDSENNIERMEACLLMMRSRDDFAYFCGCAANSARSLSLGADGIVPSCGNIVPGMYRRLYDAAVKGDMATAEEMQRQTGDISHIYQDGLLLGQTLAALKVMMQTRGLCQPYMLPPLSRLSEEKEKEIIEKTRGIDN